MENIKLAELEQRTGVSRGKIRRLKRNSFQYLSRKTKGGKYKVTQFNVYTGLIVSLLRQGTKNSSFILDHLCQAEYESGAIMSKEYIAAHRYLISTSNRPHRRATGVSGTRPRQVKHSR